MPNSTSFVIINQAAIEHLAKEWKQQVFQWPVMDTPIFQAESFQESVLFLFMGSLIHYDLWGIKDPETSYIYKKQRAEGEVAYWRTLRSNWLTLKKPRLTLQEFEHIFAGLESIPQRYAQWSHTIHVLRQKYRGQVTEFLESCQWNIPIILERAQHEFPSFLNTIGSSRLHLFLYLVQGKYPGSHLFHNIEAIDPYVDSILLAGLMQANVLELTEYPQIIPVEQFKDVSKTAKYALDLLYRTWTSESNIRIVPADLNTPLRQLGMMSLWRQRFPLGFF